MGIKIANTDEFKALLGTLANDLQTANIHLKMALDIIAAANEFADEFNESQTFWYLTINAHRDVVHFRLCRAYDQSSKALHLRSLLDLIEQNIHVFDAVHFKERLKGNPFVDSLADDLRKPDLQQLAKDKAYVNPRTNQLVKKLVRWRGNYFAHRNPEPIVGRALGDQIPFTAEEIQELAEKGMEIVNRYSILFQASSYSTNIVGRHDYKALLAAMRERIQRQDAEWRKLESEYKRGTTE